MGRNTMSKTVSIRDIERTLDNLDLEQYPAEDPVDLRRIGAASHAIQHAEVELREAVQAARYNGRSWGYIGLVLGVSRQAAQQRFG
jgi:hypothetical protein